MTVNIITPIHNDTQNLLKTLNSVFEIKEKSAADVNIPAFCKNFRSDIINYTPPTQNLGFDKI